MSVVGTLVSDGATIEVCAVDDGFGGTTFTIKVVDGYADLRGFFFDYDGGEISLVDDSGLVTESDLGTSADGDEITKVDSNDNNMNGSGETFDAGLTFGSSGGLTYQGTSDDVQWIEFTISGLTLEEIDGESFGIRALSVGEYREDSVKLLGTFDITENPEDVPM